MNFETLKADWEWPGDQARYLQVVCVCLGGGGTHPSPAPILGELKQPMFNMLE